MPKLKVNHKIQTKEKDKVYCHEDYAQELYNLYNGTKETIPRGGKDIEKYQLLKITGISTINDNEAYFEVNNMVAIPVDLNKEKRYFEFNNISKSDFVSWIKSKEGQKQFIEEKNLIYIENSYPSIKATLLGGFQYKIREELHKQIKNPTTAYNVKIISKNQGGFIVDIYGMNAFLPGGLAAANKITDFDKYIGKTVTVMVEDYLPEINTFIMSNKKYIQHILPSLVENFDTTIKHTGIVTGSIKYGVFLEFDEIFTGLLHTSKMSSEIKKQFDERKIKIGDKIECWVKEISKDCKLILTNFDPEMENKLKIDEIYDAKITSIKDFGIFVKLKTGESGLIPNFSSIAISYKIGDEIKVELISIKKDKLYFKIV